MADPSKRNLPNTHATALVVGETGILITGAAGSGKSRLALEFIQSAAAAGRFAAFVADDQVFLSRAGKKLVAVAPETIAGLVEIRGAGIIKVPYLKRAVMHVAICVEVAPGGERLPDPAQGVEVVKGLSLPLLYLQPDQLNDPYVLVQAFMENRLLL